MSKLLVALFGLVLVVAYAECFFRGNNLEGRIRLCQIPCAIRRGPVPLRKPLPVEKCKVLSEHGNATVTLCVSECLERRGVDLGATVTCDCRNRQCIPPAPKPAPVTTKPAPVTTKPAPVTTKPAPVTTRPAPVTTRPAPVTTTAAPVTTTVRPVG